MKGVIFDLDGTLLNSNALVKKIYEELIKIYPSDVSFESLDLNFVFASGYPEVLEKLYRHVKPEYMKMIHQLHEKMRSSYLSLFKGVKTMLHDLKEEGYYIGLLTSELHQIAEEELKMLDALSFFDYIVGFDDVIKPKPHPEGLLKHLAYSNLSPKDLIYVGDQIRDAEAAKACDVFVILADWNLDKGSLMSVYFDQTVSKIDELIAMIHQRKNA
ncbi:MAG: hypothetical protein A2Y45_07675 [Tenericutes bacterium GWC2_34_14]|nr:MAG: hypothetical protein A2Z84_02455 [Tenericutes bacterium GWA2_35_7]OHE29779.1 MAG: hypothetical protein A2Y45_07675 [Tenericutes bacterium GWC2_34_14]OHE34758.1 MAG: hypothetical protein A2012_01285 [Tenericutes bacterium GWE2_34_108]OHE37381.1 MAG: hypothetical protein A2Y46_01725 [Tenericutes bacterium GWF1_35_14]OHE39486.1 MAG: hypothetical protein A2Y44_01135 [Tenericutes bacterium GWF2_35_184]OHE42569.1 MAG: hypothetical protein A3K26_04235 [Tenericutes bacterium RIFOXYA12_FULL_35_